MNITIQRRFRIQWRSMTLGFKIFASHALIIFEWCIQIKIIGELIIDFIDLIVKFLRFGRGITETPCTREVIEISAATFTWKDIEYNRLAETHEISRVTGRVWHARIMSYGKDRSFRILCAEFCQPKINFGFHIANGQRGAVFLQ